MGSSAKILQNYLQSFVADGGSISNLSRASKVKRSQLHRYIAGTNVPTLDNADRILEALGTSVAEVLAGSKVAQPPQSQAHSLEDCLRTVSEAALKAAPQARGSGSVGVPAQLASLLAPLHQSEMPALLMTLESAVQGILSARDIGDPDEDGEETG